MSVLNLLPRRRGRLASSKAADVLRWTMAWSALMAGFVWLFVRVWADPSSRGERRERVAFLKRILRRVRKRPRDSPGNGLPSSQAPPAVAGDHRRTPNTTSIGSMR
jgi:hypothetical protein